MSLNPALQWLNSFQSKHERLAQYWPIVVARGIRAIDRWIIAYASPSTLEHGDCPHRSVYPKRIFSLVSVNGGECLDGLRSNVVCDCSLICSLAMVVTKWQQKRECTAIWAVLLDRIEWCHHRRDSLEYTHPSIRQTTVPSQQVHAPYFVAIKELANTGKLSALLDQNH